MKNINLIPKTEEKPLIAKERQQALLRLAVVFLAVFLSGYALTFSYRLVLSSRYRQAVNEEERLKNVISGKKSAEGLYLGFLEKLSLTEKILAERPDFAALFTRIYSFFPQGLNPLSLDFESGDKILLSLKLAEAESLDNFLKPILENPEISPNLTVSSLYKDKDGQYILNLEFSGSGLTQNTRN